jgi:HSP20 family molecular chaperone IbpA
MYKDYMEKQIFNYFGVDGLMSSVSIPNGTVYMDGLKVGTTSISDSWFNWSYKINELNEEENDEMKLGQIVEVKNGLSDIFDNVLVMLVPGYTKNDFLINHNDENHTLKVLVMGDDDYKEDKEYTFDLNEDYDVDAIDATVANGVLTVYIEYAVDGNVEVKG